MAATGYTPISLYYSTTASAVPTAGNLANGELALNIADMKLYAKNSAGTVTLLASNASTTGVDSLSFGSTGLTPSTATTGAITVAGTLNVANGGTGLTSFTANGVLYASSTSALTSGSALTFDGTNLQFASGSGLFTNTSDGSDTATLAIGGGGANSSARGSVIEFYGNENASAGVLDITSGNVANSYVRIQGRSSTSYVRFDINASEQMRLTSTGLGIGTSSPATKLQVNFGDAAGNLVNLVGDGATAGTAIATNWNTGGAYLDLRLGGTTSTYTKFRITSGGALGIGSSPSYGTSGQVLTSQGSGSAPTWATAGGGSWTYLSTVTASGAATADVETTFNSTYDMYAIVITGLTPSTTTDGWYARLKVGGSYQTANYSSNQLYMVSNSPGVAARQSASLGYIQFGYAGELDSFSSFVVYVPNPSSTSVKKSIYWTGFSQVTTLMNTFMGSAMYTGSTSALTGVRFYPAGGNLTGTFRLYGIKNS